MDEKDKEYARSIVQKSLSKQFAPEFLNRLDDIITFDQLDLNAIKRIIDLDLEGLVKRIEDLGFHFQITEKAKEMVAKKGYDVQFGAAHSAAPSRPTSKIPFARCYSMAQ